MTGPQFVKNQILTFLWRIGNKNQARTVADHFASSVVSTRRHLVALVESKFTTKGTRAEITPGRNARWNRKFLEFPIEVDQNFRNELPKTSCSIRL